MLVTSLALCIILMQTNTHIIWFGNMASLELSYAHHQDLILKLSTTDFKQDLKQFCSWTWNPFLFIYFFFLWWWWFLRTKKLQNAIWECCQVHKHEYLLFVIIHELINSILTFCESIENQHKVLNRILNTPNFLCVNFLMTWFPLTLPSHQCEPGACSGLVLVPGL